MKKAEKYLTRLIYLVIILSLSFSGCKSSQTKGRSIPKGRPIPCPVKDC